MFKYLPVLLLLGFHLYLLVNTQFTAWPEMFSYPYLRNNGYLLYKDMVHPYPPVLTMVLSIIYKPFGYNELVLKMFTWSLILFSGFLVWFLAKRITKNNLAALTSLVIYALLQPILEGNMLWFDIAIVPPLLLGAIFLLDKKYLWAGIFLALSGFIKQTGGLFYLSFLVYLVVTKTPWKNIRSYLFGPLLFGVPLLIRLFQEGALQGFLNWVIIYPSVYWSKFPGYVQLILSKSQILITSLLIAPFVLLYSKMRNRESWILGIFGVLSLVSVYPRFSFFHMQSLVAFSAVVFGIVFSQQRGWRRFALLLIPLVILWKMQPVLSYEWGRETRFLSNEDGKLAFKIESSTNEEKQIYLQGINSVQYVTTKTLPPKPWIDNYGWYFEIPRVQEEALSGWEQNPPQIIFWRKPGSGNWYDLGTYQPKRVADYIRENYLYEKDLNKDIEIWRRKN